MALLVIILTVIVWILWWICYNLSYNTKVRSLARELSKLSIEELDIICKTHGLNIDDYLKDNKR